MENILFCDIETIPKYENLEKLMEAEPQGYALWLNKFNKYGGGDVLKNANIDDGEYLESANRYYIGNAALYAEFNKIVCISYGRMKDGVLTLKSIFGDDEKKIVEHFCRVLRECPSFKIGYICAFNGKEFDFPQLNKKFIKYELTVPDIMNTLGKKPWEVSSLDTMEMYRFGSYKGNVNMETVCHFLNVPSPKNQMHGHNVYAEIYLNKNYAGVSLYCAGDVIALTRIHKKLIGDFLPLLDENIKHSTSSTYYLNEEKPQL